jgi:hypothetical protein
MVSYQKSENGLFVFRNGIICGEIRREFRRKIWAGKREMIPDKWYSWTRANDGLKEAEFSHLRYAKEYVEQNG